MKGERKRSEGAKEENLKIGMTAVKERDPLPLPKKKRHKEPSRARKAKRGSPVQKEC